MCVNFQKLKDPVMTKLKCIGMIKLRILALLSIGVSHSKICHFRHVYFPSRIVPYHFSLKVVVMEMEIGSRRKNFVMQLVNVQVPVWLLIEGKKDQALKVLWLIFAIFQMMLVSN